MSTKIITTAKIPDLIEHLQKKYEVFAPIRQGRTGGEVVFATVDPPGADKIVLNYKTTVLPPKTFFLPPEEELFTVEKGKVAEQEPLKPFVIFGLNLKDLEAICYLDQIMAKEPADSPYLEKREKAVLIAVLEQEVGTLASPKLKGGGGPPGGDLILVKDGGDYRAIPLSEAGEKIAALPVFKTRGSDPKGSDPIERTRLEELLLDPELLARAVEWSRENYPEIWERLGKQCLGCGICTYVCPLCYCFDVEDTTSLAVDESRRASIDHSNCARCRRWAACTLPSFSTVAGGFNFRKTIKDRYFNWFYHKFVRAYKEFGRAQCVACGRCQKYCPAGIDIEQVLAAIVEAFQKAEPERKF